jgi:hypothetical protein
MTIVNDDSRVINEVEASLTDDARVIIYDHHMFIVQATAVACKLMLGALVISPLLSSHLQNHFLFIQWNSALLKM